MEKLWKTVHTAECNFQPSNTEEVEGMPMSSNFKQEIWASAHEMRKPIAVPVCKLSVYFQPLRHSSLLKFAPQPKIAKINKTTYFGSSVSLKIINVDTIKKLVTSACCDRQHAHAHLQLFLWKTGQQRWNNDFYRGYRSLMPSCADFLEPRKSQVEPLKSMFNAENFICRLSLHISIDFNKIRSWNMSCSPKSPKIHKNLYLAVQGHKRSLLSVLINSLWTTSY